MCSLLSLLGFPFWWSCYWHFFTVRFSQDNLLSEVLQSQCISEITEAQPQAQHCRPRQEGSSVRHAQLGTTGNFLLCMGISRSHPALTDTSWGPTSWFVVGTNTDLRKAIHNLHSEPIHTSRDTARLLAKLDGKLECLVWHWIPENAFILVLSKTDLELNWNQSDWKHFADKRELVQISNFFPMKNYQGKCQGVARAISLHPQRETVQSQDTGCLSGLLHNSGPRSSLNHWPIAEQA